MPGPTSDQWVFPLNALDHTPSRYDGVTLDKELETRKTTITAIRSLFLRSRYSGDNGMEGLTAEEHAGIEGVINAGAMLVHRFYMRRSMKDFSERTVAATTLFLAAKMEEQPLKLRYLVNSCLAKWEGGASEWHPNHTNTKHHSQGKEYQRWENKILVCEELVLEALCFDLDISMPYKVYESASVTLGDIRWEGEDDEDMKEDRENAFLWALDAGHSLLTQAHVTPLLVLFPPHVIAFCAFMFGTAMTGGITVQESARLCRVYAPHFGLTADFDEGSPLNASVEQVRDCYTQWLHYSKMGLIDIKLDLTS